MANATARTRAAHRHPIDLESTVTTGCRRGINRLLAELNARLGYMSDAQLAALNTITAQAPERMREHRAYHAALIDGEADR